MLTHACIVDTCNTLEPTYFTVFYKCVYHMFSLHYLNANLKMQRIFHALLKFTETLQGQIFEQSFLTSITY